MKTIEFICSDEMANEVIESPKPAKSFIPDWYKDSSSYVTDDKIPIHYDGYSNHTLKRCVPIMDSMISGYMLSLPTDVYALDEEKYNGVRLNWAQFPFEVVDGSHSIGQLQNYPMIDNFEQLFKWRSWWQIKTPPGYSCLFIHPLHRNDLPFITLSGIVDTDSYDGVVQFPFFLNNNFFGKIKKGTPIVQIIPFKRDSWKGKNSGFSKEVNKNTARNFSIIGDMYKKVFWKKKEYV